MLERHAWRDLVAVIFTVALVGLGLGSTLPLTALVLTGRGFGPDMVGLTIAATALGGIVGTFATPSVSARHGRTPVMLACLMLAAASVAPLQYVTSIGAWMLLRFTFGVSMAALFLISEAWINVLSSDAVRGRVVAIYTTSFTLFQVIGPLLTDGLTRFPHSAFLICGGLFLLGAPGIMVARSNTNPAQKPASSALRTTKEDTLSWLKILRKAPAIIAGTAFFAAFDNIVLGFLPLFAIDTGFSQPRALAASAFVLTGDATLQFAAGWLSDHYGRQRVHRLYGVAVCLMLPLLPVMVHLPGIWEIYLFILGGLAGAIYTLSMVATGEYFSGAALLRAAGLMGLTWNIASSAGSAATGIVMQRFGPSTIFVVLWAMAMVFMLVSKGNWHQVGAKPA